MAKKKETTDVSKLDFEQAIDSLNEVVAQIEDGDIPLAESMDKYERGMALIKHCREILISAEKRIEKITADQKSQEDLTDDDGDEDGDSDELF